MDLISVVQRKENRKAQTLAAVELFYQEQGFAPSYRDLAEYMGMSHSAVHTLVKALRADGLIHERPPQTSRSIALTPDGRVALRRAINSYTPEPPES